MFNQFKLITTFFSGEPDSCLVFKEDISLERSMEIYTEMHDINNNHIPRVASSITLIGKGKEGQWEMVAKNVFAES